MYGIIHPTQGEEVVLEGAAAQESVGIVWAHNVWYIFMKGEKKKMLVCGMCHAYEFGIQIYEFENARALQGFVYFIFYLRRK